MPAIEYNFDGTVVKLNLESPDETKHELTVTDAGTVCSGGAPIAGNKVLFKSSDQSLASSTTMQNDDDLFLDMLDGETWVFTVLFFATEAGTNPNIKIRMGVSLGLTGSIEYSYNLVGSTAALVISDFTTESNAISLTADKKPVVVQGCVTATADGRLNFQWAQGTSDADATIVHAKSNMTAMKTT